MEQKNVGGLVGVVSNLVIEDVETVYRLHVASYLGNRCYVDIEKELEDSGRGHTQQEWVPLSQKVPSAPLYFAVMDTLHQNKDHPDQSQRALVEEVKEMLAKDFKKYFMMTSTRVRYACDGLDTVIHDFGYATERREEANIVGGDGYINEASGFGAVMGALLEINDFQKVERVGKYVTGTKLYLYRFNRKPKEEDVERALVLGGNYGGRFNFNADGNYYRRARGMVARRAENSP